ncbi:Arc family DNA binding domain-containing protein [Sphingobacterium oryzagri]|uniref:Arc family DNA binding domain-containing protein n=1 Tax=Sphingobacterium oryzagri TaxID=3025669 RepID=A0ABY7WN17_9SPHI|nr:Arc family DNA binding domain-containing protein [Sphingobacterium sp. KACC 22765]WDF70583.1 Arc family DNA binding domain-containing protein [Sphingobacterium sp. KACC 22765]
MKKNFVVRIDEAMYKKLEAWAHDEFRSVNGQIEYLINQGLIKTGRSKERGFKDDVADQDARIDEE